MKNTRLVGYDIGDVGTQRRQILTRTVECGVSRCLTAYLCFIMREAVYIDDSIICYYCVGGPFPGFAHPWR